MLEIGKNLSGKSVSKFCERLDIAKFLKLELLDSVRGKNTIVPMLVPAIYTSALIFGPVFAIVLAICLALIVRFPSHRYWIGIAMVVLGLIEFSLVPTWVLWVFTIALTTVVVGAIMFASVLLSGTANAESSSFSNKELAGIGFVVVALGVLLLASSARGIEVYAVGLVLLATGAAGVSVLLPERRKVTIGFAFAAAGLVVSLFALFTGYSALAFFVGLAMTFAGVSVGVSGLPYWTLKSSGGNSVPKMKRVFYALLAIMILSSALVFTLQTTRVLREELYDDWTWTRTADTTVRGFVTAIYLDHEINNQDYSYHIFPAIIILNVTEVTEVSIDESWLNMTKVSEGWLNQNLTIAYDKPDVPSLKVGQRIEASGYFEVPVEDPSAYSHKLVVDSEIVDSYVKPL